MAGTSTLNSQSWFGVTRFVATLYTRYPLMSPCSVSAYPNITAMRAPAFILPFILIVGIFGRAMHPKGRIIFVSTGLPVAAVCGAALFWFAVVGVMFLVVVAQRIASAHQVFGAFAQHIPTRAIWTIVPMARSTTPRA